MSMLAVWLWFFFLLLLLFNVKMRISAHFSRSSGNTGPGWIASPGSRKRLGCGSPSSAHPRQASFTRTFPGRKKPFVSRSLRVPGSTTGLGIWILYSASSVSLSKDQQFRFLSAPVLVFIVSGGLCASLTSLLGSHFCLL